MTQEMQIKSVDIPIPPECNIILGQSHFIKTIEDLYEIIVTSNPQAKFGIAFSEASGPRLVRTEGTDDELARTAAENVMKISSGHCFLIIMRNIFPISILNQIKNCQEVLNIFAATSNPLKVLVAMEGDRGAIIGVMDGFTPIGIENERDVIKRKKFLRDIGYKK